jgi:signal transduction histidine kinase
MARLVHLRLSDVAYSEAAVLSKDYGFNTVQEYFREAIRKANEERRKEKAIRGLESLRGSLKGVRRLSQKEREKLLDDYLKRGPSDMFRLLGFDKIPEAGKV